VRLDFIWYGTHPLRFLLWPLSLLFCALVWLRRQAYFWGIFRRYHATVPLVVVGNISVGGTGKTPLTIYLVTLLKQHGWQPGVVSRGYRGQARTWPQWVTPESDPAQVGDEPLLLAQHCPVAVAPQRAAAVEMLLAKHQCTIILCDDGLQHYALQRDVEIAVVDATRGMGNGWCLPAGPLRETPRRLQHVDMCVVRGEGVFSGDFRMEYRLRQVHSFNEHQVEHQVEDLATWRGREVHAVAGIGAPQPFFDALTQAGLRVIPHVFADHHAYCAADFNFKPDVPILMTSKDAVKCRTFATSRYWYVPLETHLPPEFAAQFLALIAAKHKNKRTTPATV
jgi:tetraacyldisaccharide 4'-kinase